MKAHRWDCECNKCLGVEDDIIPPKRARQDKDDQRLSRHEADELADRQAEQHFANLERMHEKGRE